MKRPLFLAGAAMIVATAGQAHATRSLFTPIASAQDHGDTVYCDIVNASPASSAIVTVQIRRADGLLLTELADQTLLPGHATSAASAGDAHYCQFVVVGGNPKNLRGVAVYSKNGKYLTALPAE